MHALIRVMSLALVSNSLVGSTLVLAQTGRGVSWRAGNVSTGRERTDRFQETNQSSTVSVGFTQGTFIQDELLLGADLQLLHTRSLNRQGLNFDALSDNRQTSLTVTPFIRRFWGKQALRGYVGGGIRVEYGRDRLLTANTKTREAEDLTTDWHVRPELQAGLFYVISAHWGVELSTRSSVAPIAFTDLSLGLVVLTGVKKGQPLPVPKKIPTQLLTGNWLLSGSFDVGTDRQRLTSAAGELATNVETRQTQLYAFSPSVGLFTGRRWVVGVSVPISRRAQTNDFVRSAQTVSRTSASLTTDAVGIAPFAKKYLTKARFGPFVAARIGWQRERTYGAGATTSQPAETYNWRIGGGLAYLLGKRFIVEGELAGVGSEWSAAAQTGEFRSRFDITATLHPAFTMSYVFL